ncbi:MAG: hypothetical protein R3293_29080, partial [Candidatus Promineifilaceae bacterium]|nr:hypothetical protein [Candidatus Promineifilaceae bacterium]
MPAVGRLEAGGPLEGFFVIRTARFARIYRVIFALLGWLALLLVWYAAAAGREAGTPLIAAVAGTFRFFTMQTNLFVMIWLLVA